MNLKSLRIFVQIMELGTLARACSKVNISQPAASRLIQILEAEFQVSLFLRERARLIPTHEAVAFYPQAIRILASIDDLPAMFKQISKDTAPPLRVICHPRLVEGLVTPALAMTLKQDPMLKVKLEVYPRRYLGRQINNDLYDVGIATLPLPDRNPATQFLAQTDMLVAIPKDHELANKKCLTTNDLEHLSYVALEDTTNMRALVDRELAKADKQLNITHEISTSLGAYQLVREGVGFAFTDAITLSPVEATGLAIRFWQPRVKIEFGYFLSETKQPHRSRQIFIEALKNICKARTTFSKDQIS